MNLKFCNSNEKNIFEIPQALDYKRIDLCHHSCDVQTSANQISGAVVISYAFSVIIV